MKKIISVILLCLLSAVAFSATSPWGRIEKLFGKKGITNGTMFKITFPRTDLTVNIDNVSISPGLALTTWLAFNPMAKGAMMMGDIVLLESELQMVQYKLDSAGIKITALHNHLQGESPRIMYMHISAQGDPVMLAAIMKSVLLSTGTPVGEYSLPPAKSANWSDVDSVMGAKGTVKGDVIQYSIPRPDIITENGMEIPPFMGTATSVNFQATDTRAIVAGDFALLANEVSSVIHALTGYSIAVTAVHSHMLDESPRIIFLHFLGFDDPVHLADGIKAALHEIGRAKKPGKTKFNLK
jgi:hypothetical protein